METLEQSKKKEKGKKEGIRKGGNEERERYQ